MSIGQKITRNEFKLKLNFYRWGQPRYYDKVRRIVHLLTSEPMLTLLPDPWLPPYTTRATLQSAFAGYEAAMQVACYGLKSAIHVRDDKRAVLQSELREVANYLEAVALKADDLTLLTRTGFDRQRPIVRHPITGMLSAPEFSVRQGPLTGSLRGDAKRLGTGVTYEAQIATDDPRVDANFKTVVFSTRARRMLFPNLAPGQLYHLRVRALGRHGFSPWSQVISRYAN